MPVPVDFTRVQELLKDNAPKFKMFAQRVEREFDILKDTVPDTFSKDFDSLTRELDALKDRGMQVGAEPTEEYKNGLFVEFPRAFTSLKEAMAWAAGYLEAKTVVCTDGSQVYPSQDFSMPVGLIQVACFKNDHYRGKNLKWLELDLLAPEDLLYENPATRSVEFGDAPVNARRFELELDILARQMDEVASCDQRPERAYFLADNTLILSYILKLAPAVQERYIKMLTACIDKSTKIGYPLVGYVDSSSAKDVLAMVMALQGRGASPIQLATDAAMLEREFACQQGRPMRPGDRTCAFTCDRADQTYQKHFKKKGEPVGFFYIKLSDQQLARAEFPAWIINARGLLDATARVLLAESIAGAGYPYAVDQCHHACVILQNDKEKFYRLFQAFSSSQGLPFNIKNKARSKRRRPN